MSTDNSLASVSVPLGEDFPEIRDGVRRMIEEGSLIVADDFDLPGFAANPFAQDNVSLCQMIPAFLMKGDSHLQSNCHLLRKECVAPHRWRIYLMGRIVSMRFI